MRDSLPDGTRPSKAPSEQLFQRKSCAFGKVIRALWPTKPALNLAQRIGCSERAAAYLINGERKVSARAVAAIIAEILD